MLLLKKTQQKDLIKIGFGISPENVNATDIQKSDFLEKILTKKLPLALETEGRKKLEFLTS